MGHAAENRDAALETCNDVLLDAVAVSMSFLI